MYKLEFDTKLKLQMFVLLLNFSLSVTCLAHLSDIWLLMAVGSGRCLTNWCERIKASSSVCNDCAMAVGCGVG